MYRPGLTFLMADDTPGAIRIVRATEHKLILKERRHVFGVEDVISNCILV
jgi:hypothetical protein